MSKTNRKILKQHLYVQACTFVSIQGSFEGFEFKFKKDEKYLVKQTLLGQNFG